MTSSTLLNFTDLFSSAISFCIDIGLFNLPKSIYFCIDIGLFNLSKKYLFSPTFQIFENILICRSLFILVKSLLHLFLIFNVICLFFIIGLTRGVSI